ncbi:MAG: 3-deoxy-manno-octulosonate cytidylyltransferase [Holophagales bacterium]|nr:3-deoxy-manno-octulosonate cytidylyltransferase [Holophagales bacterium]
MHPSETEPGPDRADGPIVGAIPARYASTRLPGKVLMPIAGKPMIEHVWRRAREADGLARVVVLTDDERIRDTVRAFGGEVEMTPADCRSGTDRIAHAARDWNCRAVINIQGDEPLIDPAHIEALAALFVDGGDTGSSRDVEMATLSTPASDEQLASPDKVKVVTGLDGHALYFSRAPIPWQRHAGEAPPRLHVGIYGYRRDALLRLAALPPSPLERAESLEQLRALENGIRIRVLPLEDPAHPGVDTEEDLVRVARLLETPDGGHR